MKAKSERLFSMKVSQASLQFIDQLRFRGVELWVDGDRLRYSAPKGVVNADVLQELKQRKADIISALLAEQGHNRTGITAVPRESLMPLSFAQQRIWFLDELEPDNPFYNVSLAKRIKGPVDTDRLRLALNQLIARHEVLRSQCISTEEGPRLRIVSAEDIDQQGDWFVIEDLPAGATAADLQAAVDNEARPPVSLRQAPLIRTRLLRIGSDDAVLTFTTHHFVVDGWSCGVLMRELSVIYAALTSGTAPDLPELTVHYADFAAWQNRWLAGPEPAKQIDYWKKTLENLGTLELPTDKPRPPVQTYRGDIHHFELPGDLGKRLQELSRSNGFTLYMTLLAAFQILLYRYSQQDDVVLGTAVSNRHESTLENLLGPFVNTLVLRGDLSGNPTFLELVAKARDVAAGAFANQDLPFENLVEELSPERDRSRSPLFQILFVVHQYSGDEELALAGAEVADYPVAPGTTMYDLFLQLIELDGKFSGSIEYSTDLFAHGTIVRMVSHLETLLESIAANPDKRILDLPLMTDVEEQRICREWNATSMPYPSDLRIEEVFSQQAAKTPDRIAVVHDNNELTYAELNCRANQLGAYLQQQGIEPGQLVGIYLDRSIDMLVTLLGILKAGATYVPLDPLFPADRIAYMIEDAGLAGLVTESARAGDLAATPPVTLRLDDCSDALAQLPTDDVPIAGTARDLAYIIYTSGSTGLPKGVQIEHRGVVNFLTSMTERPGILADDTLIAVTTLSFDIAVLELLLPLFNGARLIIADKDVAADGARLAQLIAASDATVMQATPATWQLLLNADWQGKQDLKILCGGEALPRELADRLLPVCGELWNMYGPTETTIWSAVCQVAAEGPILVGQPIGNTQIYIVDDQLRPLPPGIPGELCIAGDGVARGYLNRPELTGERFVDNPFNPDGSRLYRTGDLARYTDGGDIQCLGRNDNQVKVRGYRIELGEIETALAEHPAVNQAVVSAREDRTGEKRLVGYLKTEADGVSGDDLDEIRNDQLEQWRDLWQNAYAEGAPIDPRFNISGWSSSYTGEQIPAPQMREWIEGTAARINALQPERVLEIGCGTGLVVARVAPETARYLALDFSPASIAAIHHLRDNFEDLGHVEARQLGADQLEQIRGEKFDVIVINSVAQYFPEQSYLLDVISTATELLNSGGRLFLGDLRALSLLESYHASVQLWQAEDTINVQALAERIRQRVDGEEELLIDPSLFVRLAEKSPRLRRIELQLKRGTDRNEMSCFRYDAILSMDEPGAGSEPRRIPWQSGRDTDWLDTILRERGRDDLLITGVADARLQPEMITLAALNGTDAAELTVGELRDRISSAAPHGMQAEAIYALAARHGVHAQLIGTSPGHFNVLLTSECTVDARVLLPARDLTLDQCCNNPMQGRMQRSLAPALKDHLRRTLPEYMVPAIYMVLDSFPLTPNGKIDRNALPAPEHVSTEIYTPPRNATEEQLASIWEDLLGVDQVGVLDDFFGLGGHSLLATQLVSRIRDAFGVAVPLNSLFDHPTVAGIATALDAAPDTGAIAAGPELRVADRSQPLPLSFAQQRLWFLDELEPGTAVYNMPFALRAKGELDRSALQQALDDLIIRHESLRTVFVREADDPVQQILDNLPVTIAWEHAADTEAQQTRASELARNGFNLETGPLLRLHVLSTADNVHLLVLVIHHIVSDLWSMDVFFRELGELYGVHTGQGQTPTPLSVQYGDYAVWQRTLLADEKAGAHLEYWREQLRDAPPILELPLDYVRPAEPGFEGRWTSRRLPDSLLPAMEKLAGDAGATLFMLGFAAFALLLGRYAHESDVVIGTPISGRQRTEFENLIGFFLNTLALRVDTSGTQRFTDLLQQVRKTALDAYDHQDLPFEKLVEELQPDRDMSHTPVFQHMFIWQDSRGHALELPGLQTEPAALVSHDTAKFDLTLAVTRDDAGIEVGAEYSTELFTADTIERLLDRYVALLHQATTSPQQQLREFSLLAEDEYQRVVLDFNKTATDFGGDICVHELVERQAEKTPDAIAVCFADSQLTYQQLNARANALAGELRTRGARPGTRIAISCGRSLELAVAALAVLKSGACYVAIDPNYPDERVSAMLADSEALLILTRSDVNISSDVAPVLSVDKLDLSPEASNLPPLATPDDPLYCIYTSGSTGKPKGVQLAHRGLANLLRWQLQHERLQSPSRTLQFASFSFDVSFQELFSTWSSGGTLIMVDEELRQDLPALAAFIANTGIERLYLPYAALQPIAETLVSTGAASRLRDVVVAGEQLQVSPEVRALFATLPDAALHNQYGPSETHVVTALTLSGNAADWPALPSIGYPIANTRCYVLDEHGAPQPVGIPGELCLAGTQIAIGYLRRPELNRDKFSADPFVQDERMYRTGDRARWLQGGQLEFLGRADDQIKWRGFRVEPGEIEAALTAFDSVRHAVVILREDSPGMKRLVGYVTAAGNSAPDTNQLKAALQSRLPDYMIPGVLVVLDEMPLTPSGKIARQRLPAPGTADLNNNEFVAPRDDIETQICAIWAEVLEAERIGIEDDFFALGGHSLLATKVIARVRDAYGANLPLKYLFRYPTPARLAAAIATLQKVRTEASEAPEDDREEFRI